MSGTANDLEYFPFARDRGVVQSEEQSCKRYNAVYFNKEKFSQVSDDCLILAYSLMDFKRRCYDYIQRGGYYAKMKAVEGKLNAPPWIDNDDKRKIFQEVLSECREAGTPQGFDRKISKFQVPGEMETKDPSYLLKLRMAMCVLKIKSIPDQDKSVIRIFAASVHNYSKNPGRENYVSLLFDFLSKLPRNINFIIIIAGDFNFDILACRDRSLTQYFPSYHIPWYQLRPLREGLPTGRIDFIMVTKPKHDAQLQVSVTEVQAHDLQVDWNVNTEIGGDHRKITNHSPVSAVIELKLKK